MPRNAEQNQQIRDERREHILRTAREVFARKGLAATKISDLAAAANVSYGLVYHYFTSKEAVYTAIIETAMDGSQRLTAAALAREGSPWERLAFLCEEMTTGIRDDPEYLLIVLQALTAEAMPAEARAVLARAAPQTFDNVRTMIQQGQATGEVVAGDPNELTVALLAFVQGLAISRYSLSDASLPFPSLTTVLRLLRA